MTDAEWLVEQQRLHNLSTFRSVAEKRHTRRRYKFTPGQLAIAIRSAEKGEK